MITSADRVAATSLKTTQISNSVKIRPVGADGRTDRQT